MTFKNHQTPREDIAVSSEKTLVSVIVPIFGVEDYIEQCLRSVMDQTLREIEIICVNDQSPDQSQKIIDRLASEDPRIRVLVQRENCGQGFARNAALDLAAGEYVFFLDADDLLADSGVLEDCWRAATKSRADLVRVRKLVFQDGAPPEQAIPDPVERFFDRARVIDEPVQSPDVLKSWHIWNLFYSRELIEEHGIRFTTPQWEERYFVCKAFKHSKRLCILDRDGVRYRQRAVSTTGRARKSSDLQMMAIAIESVAVEFDAGQVSTILAAQYASFFVGRSIWAKTLCEAIKTQDQQSLDAICRAFRAFDVRFEDMLVQMSGALSLGDRTAAVALALFATQAGRWDLVETAATGGQIAQADLYAMIFGKDLQDDEHLEAALNHYARNRGVRPERNVRKTSTQKVRLILHIGASKTGSTVLQNHLEFNRPELLRQGIWYPEVGLFWQAVRPRKQAGHALFTEAAKTGSSELRNYLRAGLNLAAGRIHTIILSSEAFFLNEDSHRIADYLSEFDVEVLLYLRRQDEWANSQYCEFVAGGAVRRVSVSIEDWLQQNDVRKLLDYTNVLSRFLQVVPKERMNVRIYDRSTLHKGDLIDDFANTTGLVDILGLARPSTALSNDVRFTAGQIHLMRRYNTLPFATRSDYLRFVEDVGNRIEAGRRATSSPPSKPMLFQPDQRMQLLESLNASNALIAREWFDDPNGRLFDPGFEQPNSSDTDVNPADEELFKDAYDRQGLHGANGPPGWDLPLQIVNYGFWGWRLWALTPFVRAQVAKRGSQEDLERFDLDPSTFMHGLQSSHFQSLARRLYPRASVFGPFEILRVWVGPATWLASVATGQGEADKLREDPVLYVRRFSNPAARLLGRILFPFGELVTLDEDRSDQNST